LRITVLGIALDLVTMSEAVAVLENFIAERQPRMVATANAEMVMLAQNDEVLAKILNQADLIVPDGAGVVWAARHQGQPVRERVAGYDLAQTMLSRSAEHGYRVFFFGGAPGIAERAEIVAGEWYPGISIVGTHSGFFTASEEPEIVAAIRNSKPDILLVALGVPKQEKWLAAHMTELQVPVAIGVGGSFDVMAGVAQRAPLWMQRAGLEWLFRLLRQPSRLVRMLALPHFVIRVLTAKKH